MIAPDVLEKTVTELASRPKHEKVRTLVHRLLTDALGADSTQIDFERQVPEVKGRIDALLGRTIIEIKSDLRRELTDAKHQLSRYLPQRERETGQRYVGLATDGAEFIAYETDGDDGLTPWKWSIARVGLRTRMEDHRDGDQASQAGGDRRQAAPG